MAGHKSGSRAPLSPCPLPPKGGRGFLRAAVWRMAFSVISAISVVTETAEGAVKLSKTMREVVLHWGEMGTSWGVNRSVGQIHALLYLVGKPMTAEEISDTLSLARSNVSTSLKELQDWDLVERRQQLGDRRDYFTADGDLWDVL